MNRCRRLLATCVVLASALGALVALAGPAVAADAMKSAPPGGGSAVSIIVSVYTGVTAEIRTALPDQVHSVTVAALQCSSSGSGCTTIAANSDVGHLWITFGTSSKTYSPGHTYKAVGSWTDSAGKRYTSVTTALACCPTP
jgi:hypothetical protein